MRETKYANVRYCPHLQRNVIIEGRPSSCGGVKFECLNRSECGFSEKGCRNLLWPDCRERRAAGGDTLKF